MPNPPDLSANPGLIYMAKTHQENGMGEEEFLMLALTAGYDKPPGIAKASWDAALPDDTPDAADLNPRTPLNWQKKYQALRSWADGAKVDIDDLEDEVKRLREFIEWLSPQGRTPAKLENGKFVFIDTALITSSFQGEE